MSAIVATIVRIRPLLPKEEAGGRVEGLVAPPSAEEPGGLPPSPAVPLSLRGIVSGRPKAFDFAFSRVFGEVASNADVHAAIAPTLLGAALSGRVGTLCAHGYTGSGKSHSIVGYRGEQGLFSRAAADLCAALPAAAAAAGAGTGTPVALALSVRVVELYLSRAYDLVAKPRTELAVREDAEGAVRLRGAVTVGAHGEVSVRVQAVVTATTPAEVDNAVAAALASRAVGSSTAHHESSRSHCILEVEVVTPALADARAAALSAEAALVPLGRARDAAKMALTGKQFTRGSTPGGLSVGGWTPTGYRASPEEEEEAGRLERAFAAGDAAVAAANVALATAAASAPPCVGGSLVFVDLAGADYDSDVVRSQPPAQRREATEINTALLALKSCLRGLAAAPDGAAPAHLPWRDSRLTHLLRAHLSGAGATCVLLATVAPAAAMLTRTANTLSYAQLGGGGGGGGGGQ